MTSWKQEFENARAGDDSPVVAVAPPDIDMDKQFDSGYGGSEGEPILIWTESYVYFPVVYDGAEWLERAPRNPTKEGLRHVGGE